MEHITRLGIDKEKESRSFRKPISIKYKTEGLPNSIDWRDFNGANWITSIKNQGNCSCCAAFGANATLEALLKINYYRDATKDLDLSEAHLFWCSKGENCKDGLGPEIVGEYLKNNGVPYQSCFPYKDKPNSCKNTCPNWIKAPLTQILDFKNSGKYEINTMKLNLVNNGPQMAKMGVYEDFMHYKSGIYEHVEGNIIDGHSISVVGYNDNEGKGYWICKNSWGTHWGENGFFRIAYGDVSGIEYTGMWNLTIKDVPLGPGLSDDSNWDKKQYYETIQFADIDGDGHAELIARSGDGINVWKYNSQENKWNLLRENDPGLSDDSNWNQEKYYETIQFADIDGDGHAELIARSGGGINVWKYDPQKNKWNLLRENDPSLSDDSNWDKKQYYETIQFADIDGDGHAELIARSGGGINVWKYDPQKNKWFHLDPFDSPGLNDIDNWNQEKYYKTIQFADIDGDGHAELIARGSMGIFTFSWPFTNY